MRKRTGGTQTQNDKLGIFKINKSNGIFWQWVDKGLYKTGTAKGEKCQEPLYVLLHGSLIQGRAKKFLHV